MKKNICIILSLILCVIFSIPLFACNNKNEIIRTRTVFGSSIPFCAKFYGMSEKDVNILYQEMSDYCDSLSSSIDPHDENSDVYKFNNQIDYTIVYGGENILGELDEMFEFEVSEDCYLLVYEAIEYYKNTQNVFDITINELMELWCVDAQSLEDKKELENLPTQEEIEEMRLSSNPLYIQTKAANGRYFLIKDNDRVKIDLGGIAKGYLLDRLEEIAKEYTYQSISLDVGGALRLMSSNVKSGKNNYWKIGITDPVNKYNVLPICAVVATNDVSVSTSGTYERGYFTKDQLYISHIIDPRATYLVNKDSRYYGGGMPITLVFGDDGNYYNSGEYVMSATVWGGTSEECDVMSTVACILGKDSISLLENMGLKAVLFTKNKKMYTAGYVEFDPEYTLYKSYEHVNK